MKIIIDIANLSRFDAGRAEIIGKRPQNQPYVNIYDKDENLVASITATQMTKLYKAWGKANQL